MVSEITPLIGSSFWFGDHPDFFSGAMLVFEKEVNELVFATCIG